MFSYIDPTTYEMSPLSLAKVLYLYIAKTRVHT